mmetsp:Transcript_78659/g.163552  ORF Transcript_78659/g.163552 Transcript_78659/m.163552 type:complete len:608 (-) Transcript_78659:119-1942(-)|eukprot:CAMPEP_0206421560 /NCGR_PEP_ID=MMETSP0324_2-20121206/1517_1 /ASSEMBLY_ACC=CAM_ASM_000836 /TAXON_ID=2866 /ORGANISM="Crypthecodinium cohnii, Strain Seligo" /LENGTH=607 /DNA_ID=CAMNT_0053885671 /DNA_START=40 /DNA_END=1863 /DNA_ORIENTATION=-
MVSISRQDIKGFRQEVGLPMLTPHAAGLEDTSLERFRASSRREVDKEHTPGVAHVILKDGKVVFAESSGWSDSERRTPFSLRTACRMHGATRPMVLAGFLTLVDEGRVQLEDKVSAYVPFSDMVADGKGGLSRARREATLLDLTRHCAGLGYEDTKAYSDVMESVKTKKVKTLQQLCKALAKLPLIYQPGTRYAYSFCTDFLGYVCEAVSGLDLQQFLEKRLFKPLDMKDTFFRPFKTGHSCATLYERIEIPPGSRHASSSSVLAPYHVQKRISVGEKKKSELLLCSGEWVRLKKVGASSGEFLTASSHGVLSLSSRLTDDRSQLFCLISHHGKPDVKLGASSLLTVRSAICGMDLLPLRSSSVGRGNHRTNGSFDVRKSISLARCSWGSGRGGGEGTSIRLLRQGVAWILAWNTPGEKQVHPKLIVVKSKEVPQDPICSIDIFSGGGGVLSYADAGLFSSARDYARFVAMLMNGGCLGERRILKRQLVSQLWEDEMEALALCSSSSSSSSKLPKGVKGWHDGSDFWAKTGWSLLNAHLVMDSPLFSKGKRRPLRMWMAGSGGPGWGLDASSGLAAVTVSSVLGGAEADAEGAAQIARRAFKRKHGS